MTTDPWIALGALALPTLVMVGAGSRWVTRIEARVDVMATALQATDKSVDELRTEVREIRKHVWSGR